MNWDKKRLNKFLIKDKRAGEKILSVWWIFVLVVIGGAIVIGVLIYYNADFNIKELEADILAERIVRCLVQNGYLRQDFLQENFDIFKECRLKKEMFEKESNFYFKISAQNETGLLRENIIEGDASFEKNCEISGTLKAKHFPKCSYKNERVLYYENNNLKEAKLKIIAGSNQEIKKVPVVK